VTDVNGCETTANVTITVQPELVVSANSDDYIIGTCPGSVANLTATAFGGEELAGGGYTWSWSPAASLDDPASKTPVASPAVTTTYTVEVTDANGCTTTDDITITVADPLTVTATTGDNLIGTGGEAPYSYSWDNGATLDDDAIQGPQAKPSVSTTYTVTVTDANGCQA